MKCRYLLISVFFFFCATSATAHNVWLERDGDGPARVYFGHIGGMLEQHGGRLDIIKAEEVLFPQGVVISHARLTDHISIKLRGEGDVALVEAMTPRKSRTAEEIVRTIFLARAGRSETKPLLALDLVPEISEGNVFTLLCDGKPLAATKVKVYDPDYKEQTYMTDDSGQVTLETPRPGRYIALAAQILDQGGEVNGAGYQQTRYSMALSFMAVQ